MYIRNWLINFFFKIPIRGYFRRDYQALIKFKILNCPRSYFLYFFKNWSPFRKIRLSNKKIYSLFIAVFTLIVASVIYLNTDFLSELTDGFTRIEEVFRHALFQVVSIITTTGFTTADYTAWGPILLLIFFLLWV